MPNFKGNDKILLQPNDEAVPYRFDFDACSSSTSNDGFLPYGTTISGVSVSATTDGGVDTTDELISSTSVNSNNITVALNYPSTTGEGRYHLTFILTLDSGSVLEADYNGVVARDK